MTFSTMPMRGSANNEWFQLVPARTDRAALVGMTGSGKTTLARFLLNHRKYKVVLDYKGRIDWPEYERHTNFNSLRKSKKPALLYVPDYDESIDEDSVNKVWEWIYLRGNTTVYVDETTAITQGDTYPLRYGSCLVRGRELGIEVWSATQRPTRIPQVVLSESEHIYAFCLRLPQDRERVEAFSGIPRREIANLSKQHFFYARQEDRAARGPFRLDLSENLAGIDRHSAEA